MIGSSGTPVKFSRSCQRDLLPASLQRARIYPVHFIGQGQPAPSGGAIGFTARLSAEVFGAGAARILPSGAVAAP